MQRPVYVFIAQANPMLLKSYENKNCVLIVSENQHPSIPALFPKVHRPPPFDGSKAPQICG